MVLVVDKNLFVAYRSDQTQFGGSVVHYVPRSDCHSILELACLHLYHINVYVYIFFLLGGCLLYTSPSPRDRQKSRMPSSA